MKISSTFIKNFLPIAVFVLLSIAASSQSRKKAIDINHFTQSTMNRTAADWEPAISTMIVYPLSIPYKLVVELAKSRERPYRDFFHLNLLVVKRVELGAT